MESRESVLQEKYAALSPHLTERGRQIWAATEAKRYGQGSSWISGLCPARMYGERARREVRQIEIAGGFAWLDVLASR